MRGRKDISYVIVNMVHFNTFITVILKRDSIDNIVLFSFTLTSSWCLGMEAILAVKKKKKKLAKH